MSVLEILLLNVTVNTLLTLIWVLFRLLTEKPSKEGGVPEIPLVIRPNGTLAPFGGACFLPEEGKIFIEEGLLNSPLGPFVVAHEEGHYHCGHSGNETVIRQAFIEFAADREAAKKMGRISACKALMTLAKNVSELGAEIPLVLKINIRLQLLGRALMVLV